MSPTCEKKKKKKEIGNILLDQVKYNTFPFSFSLRGGGQLWTRILFFSVSY